MGMVLTMVPGGSGGYGDGGGDGDAHGVSANGGDEDGDTSSDDLMVAMVTAVVVTPSCQIVLSPDPMTC